MADFVTNLVYKAIGIDQITKQLREAGVAQKEIDKVIEEHTRNQKKADEADRARTDALKMQARALDDLTKSAKAAQGALPKASIGGMLGSDPMTRDFAKYQSAIALHTKTLGTQTGADADATRLKIEQIEQQYAKLGARIAATAGISKDMFLNQLTPDHYQRIVAAARQLNAELDKQAKGHQEVSTKGRFSTNQMLQYTAAIRNTAESLASGMSPTTVAMTQGMQVLGAYMGENIGLMVKLGGVAAVAAVAMVPFMRALSLATQAREINAASIAYNNMAVSVNNAADAVIKLSEGSKFSRGDTLEAIKTLTSMRNLSPVARQGIQDVVTQFATATGKELPDATKTLGEAFNGTFESIRKLDETFGFLNSSQLNSIQRMMKLGDVTNATKMALDAFTKQMKGAADAGESDMQKIGRALGNYINWELDRAAQSPVFKFLISRASGVADEALSHKQMTPVESAQRDLTYAYATGKGVKNAQERLAALKAESDIEAETQRLILKRNQANAFDKASGLQGTASQEAISLARMNPRERAGETAFRKAMESPPAGLSDEGVKKYASAERANALAEYTAGLTQAEQAVRRQMVAERELADASFLGARAMTEVRARAAEREAAATGQNPALARAASLERDRTAALQSLGTEVSRLRDQEEMLASIKTKGFEQATIDMRLKQSGLAGTRDEAQARVAIIEIMKRENEVKEHQHRLDVQAVNDKIKLLGAQNDNLAASEKTYQAALIEAQKLEDPVARRRAIELAGLGRAEANAQMGQTIRQQMNPEAMRSQRLADLEAATGTSEMDRAAKRHEIELQYQDDLIRRKELETDWASGADRAMMGYVKTIGSVADQTERLMTNAFRGMEDALTEFAYSGKISFSSLAESIIKDLIRMQVQASITTPMKAIMTQLGGAGGMLGAIGGLFGLGGGGVSNAAADSAFSAGFTNLYAHGGAFNDNGNIIPFAKGGVVNGMTPFRFGQGGAVPGIMGEAGPEAIVPLTRTPQGDLGIRSTGGGAVVNVEVIDQRSGGSPPIEVEQMMGALGPVIRIIARAEADKRVSEFASNEMPKALRGEYKMSRPPIARG